MSLIEMVQSISVATDAQEGRARLAIVCANCHRVIHLRDPPYSLEEMKEMVDAT